MNTKKVIGTLVYILGVILLTAFADNWADAFLLIFGVLAMVQGWELMDG